MEPCKGVRLNSDGVGVPLDANTKEADSLQRPWRRCPRNGSSCAQLKHFCFSCACEVNRSTRVQSTIRRQPIESSHSRCSHCDCIRSNRWTVPVLSSGVGRRVNLEATCSEAGIGFVGIHAGQLPTFWCSRPLLGKWRAHHMVLMVLSSGYSSYRFST